VTRPGFTKHFQEGSAELQIPPLRYAPVGMTKGRGSFPYCVSLWMGQTADPSASLGMTKGRATLPFRFDATDDEQQVPPLRYASVGMTPHFGHPHPTQNRSVIPTGAQRSGGTCCFFPRANLPPQKPIDLTGMRR
jgi:hypothetical protein